MLKNNRDKELHIRLFPNEKWRIGIAARKCGMSVSAYARDVMLGYSPKSTAPAELERLMQTIYKAHDELNICGRKEIADSLRTAALSFQRACIDPKEN